MECKSTLFGLLAHPSERKLLLLQNKDGWTLPVVQVDNQLDLYPSLATKEMTRLLGRPVVAIRYESISVDKHNGRKEGFFILEFPERNDRCPLIEGSQWISEEQLRTLEGIEPKQRDAIHSFFRETTTSLPDFRQPWEQSGWYWTTISWIEQTLSSLHIQMTGIPEQVKWWSLSCVLRIPTDTGDIYFKASAQQPLFVSEARLLDCLARLYPEQVPAILAVDTEQDLLLLRDAGSKLIRDATTVEQKVDLVQTFGRIQLDSIQHNDKLIRTGCAERRPGHAIPLIAPLLEDELVVCELMADEISDLRRHLPIITEMCAKLSDYAVPSTLVHGDLHLGNVARREQQLIFFDWTDGCIAHPFMDMFLIYDEQDEVKRACLRDAYLELWLEFEPMERLLELWTLCEVAHAVYHTISYQSILRHTEARARWELGAPAFYLRKVLRYLSNSAL